jgi:dTDP-4-dehydrorhamnose reductase
MPISTSEPPGLLLVLGMGYSASRFVELHRGKFARVAATARRMDKVAALKADGVEAHLFDGAASPGLLQAAHEASHVLVSIPPGESGDPALNALGPALVGNRALSWIGYLSTTAVYGDQQGGWVDEDTPVSPQSARAKRRAAAEEAWRALAHDRRAVQIFRLSGIYGPGRNALVDLKHGNARRLTKPGQVFNRIHVDDIARVLAAAIERPGAGPVFNLADQEPAPVHEVVTYAAGLLGIEAPPLMPAEEAGLSDMAKSFWAENKRISIKGLQTGLGVDLAFPTYREGLASLFAAGEGR